MTQVSPHDHHRASLHAYTRNLAQNKRKNSPRFRPPWANPRHSTPRRRKQTQQPLPPLARRALATLRRQEQPGCQAQAQGRNRAPRPPGARQTKTGRRPTSTVSAGTTQPQEQLRQGPRQLHRLGGWREPTTSAPPSLRQITLLLGKTRPRNLLWTQRATEQRNPNGNIQQLVLQQLVLQRGCPPLQAVPPHPPPGRRAERHRVPLRLPPRGRPPLNRRCPPLPLRASRTHSQLLGIVDPPGVPKPGQAAWGLRSWQARLTAPSTAMALEQRRKPTQLRMGQAWSVGLPSSGSQEGWMQQVAFLQSPKSRRPCWPPNVSSLRRRCKGTHRGDRTTRRSKCCSRTRRLMARLAREPKVTRRMRRARRLEPRLAPLRGWARKHPTARAPRRRRRRGPRTAQIGSGGCHWPRSCWGHMSRRNCLCGSGRPSLTRWQKRCWRRSRTSAWCCPKGTLATLRTGVSPTQGSSSCSGMASPPTAPATTCGGCARGASKRRRTTRPTPFC